MINWLAYTKNSRAAPPPLEAWDTVADKALAVERFEGWTYPWLDVRGLIARTERVLQLPNVDRDPISRWSLGRVTLIGDAAHPMLPVAPGRLQAWSTAACLRRRRCPADPAEALAATRTRASRR